MTADTTDQEHLRLLAIFHYVVGSITAFFALLPLIHLGFGIAMLVAPHSFGSEAATQPPGFIGWIFAAMGAVFFLCGQALAICMIVSGRFLQRKARYMFVFVMACIECILMPFGTVLGVFTIIVLSRESVKRLFSERLPPPIPA
jgi:hypothetical protein